MKIDVVYGFAAMSPRDCLSVRPMPNALYVDPAAPTSGDCKGCGAPWEILPVDTHAVPVLKLIDRYNRCRYCKRPFKS